MLAFKFYFGMFSNPCIDTKQEKSLKKINGDQYEKTLRNGICAYYLN